MNIVDHIFANGTDTNEALVHDADSLTYGDLRSLVDEASAALRATGYFEPTPGHSLRIGLSCPNGFAHIIFSLAVLRCGGCLVPIASELTNAERDALVASTGIDLVLTSVGQEWHRDLPESSNLHVGTLQGKILRGLRTPGTTLDFDEKALGALNPALIRFSSGTTGTSKGIVLSHETLLARVTACNSRLQITSEDRVIWILPMTHHFAVSIILYLLHGAATIIADSHLAEDVAREVEEHRGTVLYAAPFHHALLCDYPAGRPFDSLRLAVSTAAALPQSTADKFRDRYEHPLTQGLGIIEIGLPLLNDANASTDPLAIGQPQEGFETKLIDEQGNDVPKGEVGELLLRGPGMFDAYLSPWQLRDEVLDRGGFFHTGDLARSDNNGNITLCGRLKAVINVAGMKVFAEEVETVLCEHPDVAEARVSSTPHPLTGSVPIAEIVATDPKNAPRKMAVISFCRKMLSHYKVPMKVTWVEALPRTPSGKIKR